MRVAQAESAVRCSHAHHRRSTERGVHMVHMADQVPQLKLFCINHESNDVAVKITIDRRTFLCYNGIGPRPTHRTTRQPTTASGAPKEGATNNERSKTG